MVFSPLQNQCYLMFAAAEFSKQCWMHCTAVFIRLSNFMTVFQQQFAKSHSVEQLMKINYRIQSSNTFSEIIAQCTSRQLLSFYWLKRNRINKHIHCLCCQTPNVYFFLPEHSGMTQSIIQLLGNWIQQRAQTERGAACRGAT